MSPNLAVFELQKTQEKGTGEKRVKVGVYEIDRGDERDKNRKVVAGRRGKGS